MSLSNLILSSRYDKQLSKQIVIGKGIYKQSQQLESPEVAENTLRASVALVLYTRYNVDVSRQSLVYLSNPLSVYGVPRTNPKVIEGYRRLHNSVKSRKVDDFMKYLKDHLSSQKVANIYYSVIHNSYNDIVSDDYEGINDIPKAFMLEQLGLKDMTVRAKGIISGEKVVSPITYGKWMLRNGNTEEQRVDYKHILQTFLTAQGYSAYFVELPRFVSFVSEIIAEKSGMEIQEWLSKHGYIPTDYVRSFRAKDMNIPELSRLVLDYTGIDEGFYFFNCYLISLDYARGVRKHKKRSGDKDPISYKDRRTSKTFLATGVDF